MPGLCGLPPSRQALRRRRAFGIPALLFAALLCLPDSIVAQNDPRATPGHTKTGRVADAVDRRGLGEALIDVPELGIHQISEPDGGVRLEGLPAGRYSISAARLGYERVDGELDVPGDGTFLILLPRAQVEDADAPAEVLGQITGAKSGEPLADVEVTVVGQDRARVLSNHEGRFLLQGLTPGLLEVRLTRLGYATRTTTLVVQPEGRGEIVATMSTEPIELEPIEVTTTGSAAYLRRVGFEERRAGGVGNQFTREDVDDWAFREMSDLIARSHGIIVVGGVGVPPAAFAVNNRAHSLLGGTCILPIFLDGVRLTSSDLNQSALWSAHVEAVEVYTGNDVPVRFGGTNPCGVVLVWTRH